MMIASPEHGEHKLKPVTLSNARYGTSGQGRLLPQVQRLNKVEKDVHQEINRRRKVMEMPPDYICPMCRFDSTDCIFCLDTDILAIPTGELDGTLSKSLGYLLTPEVVRGLITVHKDV